MPKYVYYCKNCKNDFEIKHTLQETCIICNFCEEEGQLERRPSIIFISKKMSNFEEKSSPGDVVKSYIQDAKKDLQQEQQKLKKREFKK